MREFSDDLSDQIIYRGEGNSSIVVALRDKCKVIRLLKRDGKIMRSSQDHCVTQHPMRSIRFIHSIMKPLTSPYLSDNTELVHLKSDFINLLSKRVETERPAHRLDKTLNLDDQYALVMDDLCGLPANISKHLTDSDYLGPTISVEIKPKQGFLLPSQRLNTTTLSCPRSEIAVARIKGSCLYGLYQHFKLARGRIDRISNYCPLNLFSGCLTKMRAALQALLDNPQNNLRIFRDLALVYDETNFGAMSCLFDDIHAKRDNLLDRDLILSATNRNRELLIDLLIQCLLSEPTTNRTRTSDTMDADNTHANRDENLFSTKRMGDQCMWHSCSTERAPCAMYQDSRGHEIASQHKPGDLGHTCSLPKSCVLASVLRAQRLDSIGPFEAGHMLDWLLNDSNDIQSQQHKKQQVKDVLEELSKPRLPEGFGAPAQLPFESKRDYYFRKVWEFLVSLTAKDCSIIITVRQITQASYEMLRYRTLADNLLVDKIRGRHFVFHVGIADFDQKMPLKIPRICENLNQIMFLIRNQENIPRLLPKREPAKEQSE